MSVFTRQELEALAAKRSGPWVSLYTTVGITNDAKRAATIRLKDRLRECESGLAASGIRPVDARAMLTPVSA